jgi:hypothetical protein
VLAATSGRPDMRALYVRNIPADIAERLTHLAWHESLSLNAFVVRELTAVVERAGKGDVEVA